MNAFRSQRRTVDATIDLLPPERSARRTRAPIHRMSTGDIVEAQFVTVARVDRARFPGYWSNDNRNDRAATANVGSRTRSAVLFGKAVTGVERALGRLSDRNFAILVALVFGLVFVAAGLLLGQGGAQPARTAALDITHVTLTPQDANGMQVLLVNAIIENHGAEQRPIPRVRADLVSGGQVVASTFIDGPAGSIGAGESRGLAARLRHPGGKSPELRLSFAEAGARSI